MKILRPKQCAVAVERMLVGARTPRPERLPLLCRNQATIGLGLAKVRQYVPANWREPPYPPAERSAIQVSRRLAFHPWLFICYLCLGLAFPWNVGLAQTAKPGTPTTNIAVIAVLEGKAEIARAGAAVWRTAITNDVLKAGDSLRTDIRSWVVLRLPNRTTFKVDELSVIQMPPRQAGGI
jgi:hypothetical protein